MYVFYYYDIVRLGRQRYVRVCSYLMVLFHIKYMDRFGKLRAKLRALPGHSKKRKREDLSNPLVQYIRAIMIPAKHRGEMPELPFKCVAEHDTYRAYDVTGNPPLTMLYVYTNGTYELE